MKDMHVYFFQSERELFIGVAAILLPNIAKGSFSSQLISNLHNYVS